MTTTLQIRALAHSASVRAPEPLASVLTDCLAGVTAEGEVRGVDESIDLIPHDDGRWTMVSDGADAAEAPSDKPARLLVRLLEHLNRSAAMSVADAIPFHAAAVEAPDGRVVLLAGASGSGKSTLCAAAVMRGWKLVAEEVAAVDPESHAVRSYHRPIGLRPGGAAALGVVPPPGPWFDEVYPWCPEVAALSGGGTLAAIVVVSLSGSIAEPTFLTPAVALTEMIRHVVIPDDDRVAVGFHRLANLVRSVPVGTLVYDTPDAGLVALDRLVQL